MLDVQPIRAVAKWKGFFFVSSRLLIAVVFGTGISCAQSFDKPLKKRVIDLGQSKLLMSNDHRDVTVTCWYYPHFMVKEESDPGNKGAVRIALAPFLPGHFPKCLRANQTNEAGFKVWDAESKFFLAWDGYFAGVKHDLVFLEGSDGDSLSGRPFTVFKGNTTTRVFEDSFWVRKAADMKLRFVPTSTDQVVLRYLRVASAACSIPKDGEACWSKLKQQTGLLYSSMPTCSDYEGKEAGTAASVIAYPVEVSLFPKPATRPVGEPVSCYPTE